MWFRVDDKLPSHVKARRLRRSHPDKRRDSAPFGLWVLGGAFSDDGFVPLEVLEDWDDDAEVLADRLVAAGLWEHAEKAGEAGYRFHDWATLNPADASQSGVFGNHQRWHVGAGKPKENCPICQSEGLVPMSGANRPDDRPDIAPDIAPESLPDPNRPDPNRPEPTTISVADAPAEPIHLDPDKPAPQSTPNPILDAEFETFYSQYPRKIAPAKARQAYRAARKKATLTDILAGLDTYKRTKPSYADWAFPSTWLNGERWLDQAEPDPADPWEAFRGYDPDAPTQVDA